MKKQFLITGLLVGMFAVLLVTSCKKKDKDEDPTESLDPQVKQHNSDANNYKSESDQADNDINNALSEIPAMGGRPASEDGGNNILSSPLCGVTIDSSQIANKIIKFNFDGTTSCFSPSRIRSGQIVAQLTTGNYWRDAGSVLTLTYNNFKILRQSDNKSIMFNGTKTLKNINGNNWLTFLTSTSTLKYQERALNVAVTFDNGQTATWNSARITEWTYMQANSNNIPYAHIKFTAVGDTTVNGYNNVDSWGVNRYSMPFTTYYHSALTSNTYCGLWRFSSGELVHHVNSNDFTFTMGVNTDGTASTGACAYGFKVVWVGTNGTANVILSY